MMVMPYPPPSTKGKPSRDVDADFFAVQPRASLLDFIVLGIAGCACWGLLIAFLFAGWKVFHG